MKEKEYVSVHGRKDAAKEKYLDMTNGVMIACIGRR